jgi:hypothetical protein
MEANQTNQTSDGIEESGIVAEVPAPEEARAERPDMAEYIEDIDDVGAGKVPMSAVLDDSDLMRGGIVPVKAYMRTKASANALRQQRKRERQAENGARQLAVLAPADDASRNALKAVGVAMRERGLAADTVSLVGNAEPEFVQKLFALDRKTVELVSGCDAGAVERLMAIAAMLDRDPDYVIRSMQLDEALVRTIPDKDATLVAKVLALPEATLREMTEPAEATATDSANAEASVKPRFHGLWALLPEGLRHKMAAA